MIVEAGTIRDWQAARVYIHEHGVIVDAERSASVRLRPLTTDELPIYSGFTMAIVDLAGRSLSERIAEVFRVKRAHRLEDFYEESDARYALRSSAYHLIRLTEIYAEVTDLFETQHPVRNGRSGNVAGDRVYFEFDAFIASARRVYEHLRRVLWKKFSGRGDAPSTFAKLTRKVDFPPRLQESLTSSWLDHGQRIKDYRDCISHFVPLDPGLRTSWLEPIGERWGMTVRIPSNPDAKSRRSFSFDNGPDALSYAYETLVHLTELSEIVEASISQP